MKKLFVTICILVIAAVCCVTAQSTSVIPDSQSTTVKFQIPSGTAQGLMSYASFQQGSIRVAGTNAIITGVATIVVPASTLVGVIGSTNMPPDGYSVTNLSSGQFTKSTNGFSGTATFTKSAQH